MQVLFIVTVIASGQVHCQLPWPLRVIIPAATACISLLLILVACVCHPPAVVASTAMYASPMLVSLCLLRSVCWRLAPCFRSSVARSRQCADLH